MQIQEILNLFYEKMTQIYLYQRAANDLMTAEINELSKHAEFLNGRPDLRELEMSVNNMFFNDPISGNPIFYGHITSTIEERISAIYLHKNKQYQWLLAEAYEEFEDFLEAAYASTGYYDKNFWPLIDYGNISLQDISKKDWDWHFNQVKSKKGLPQSILTIFRQKFPNISEIEKNNKLKHDLKFMLALIAQLRHHIVHTAGKVKNKDRFIEKVLNEVGLFNNGNPKIENTDFINNFLSGDENIVALLEIRIRKEIPLNIHVSPFDILCRFLLSQAHIISKNILEHQSKNPPGNI